ncbi:MAG: CoA-acylating methylmalonate-semialdehyde dehydrogenase [Terrimicrobiaceae bacterium]|nr:CoA-acylating methylmalonate-semialdehyde dehydrogenase [Terrimicrobiaceae bacterium]
MRKCPHFVDGTWREDSVALSPVFNPSLGEVIAEAPMAGADLVDSAVRAADGAFVDWWETPVVDRVQVFFRYKMLLEEHLEELVTLVATEHGKTLTEARGDVRRGIQMVEFATSAPSLLMGETLENVARGIDCEAVRQPLGVCVGITPFNFPAMVPLWMFPVALACGNSFVLKPSEKVPLTAVRLTELLLEAGLPPGVFQLVHGGREAVDALLTHPLVRAVSFVGSTPVAREVFLKGTAHGKRVQAAGGAKNFILLMPDAPVDEAVRGLTEAAFGCAGERCMAGSMAVAVGEAGDRIVPALVESARSIKVGPTFNDPSAQMGPVITAAHRDRVERLIAQSEGEGAKIAADGRHVLPGSRGFFVGPTVLDQVLPGSTPMKEEIFGPVLSVLRMDDLDAAIEIANQSVYGNGAAIFTKSGRAAREFKHRIQAGMVGINVGVPAAMAMFPFSGWNESFFGDLHIQGKEAIAFYTRQKVTTSRWFGDADVWAR